MSVEPPSSAQQLRDWLRKLKEASELSYSDISRSIGDEQRNVKRWMDPSADKPTTPMGDALLRTLDTLGVTVEPPPPAAVSLSLAGEVREIRKVVTDGVGSTFLPRERELLRLMGEGQTLDEAAASLGYAPQRMRNAVEGALWRMGRMMEPDEAAPERERERRLVLSRLQRVEASVDELKRNVTAMTDSLERLLTALDAESADQPADPVRQRARKGPRKAS